MTLSSLVVFALTLLITAGPPGPSVAALLARVLTHGFRDVLPFLIAMWFGEAFWLTCAVTGLAVLAHQFALAFLTLKFASVAYLLFLAARMWFAPAADETGRLPGGQSPWRMFVAGLTVTLGNPKIMIFYLALLPTIVDVSHVGLLAWLQLTMTTLILLAMVDCGWALLAVRARRLLASRRAVKVANRAGATMMAGAAVAIAAR